MDNSERSEMMLRRLAWTMVSLAGLFTLAILLSGVPLVGYDAFFHLNNLAQYTNLREAGATIPRWTPNSYFGFGSATFYFYPPLTYIIGSIFYGLTHSFPWSMRMVSMFGMVSMVASCRWYLSMLGLRGRNAWLASIVYAVGPYAFYDLIIRSNYPEFLSLAWVPIVFGSVEQSLRSDDGSKKLLAVVSGCVGCSLMILTSIPMTAVLACALPFYFVVRLQGRRISCAIPFVLSVFLAMWCTAFYLWPILQFQHAAHLDYVSALGNERWFGTSLINQLLSGKNRTDSYFAVLMLVLCSMLEVLWFIRWRKDRGTLSLGWVVLLGIVLLAQFPALAVPVVRVVPILGIIQFPPRFYVFIGFALSVLLAVEGKLFERKSVYILVSGASCLALVFGCSYFYLHSFQTLTEFPIEQKMQWSAFEYVPVQTIGDTATIQLYTKVHQNDPEIAACTLLKVGDMIRTIDVQGNTSHFQIDLHDSLQVRFHHFYWPMWHLSSSIGNRIATAPDTNGILTAVLPSGRYALTLEIARSDTERLGEELSLFGVGILVLLYASDRVLAARRTVLK